MFQLAIPTKFLGLAKAKSDIHRGWKKSHSIILLGIVLSSEDMKQCVSKKCYFLIKRLVSKQQIPVFVIVDHNFVIVFF